jgi:hypothetical protein
MRKAGHDYRRIKCAKCGRDCWQRIRTNRNQKRGFCSKECATAKSQCTCTRCGKTFLRQPSQVPPRLPIAHAHAETLNGVVLYVDGQRRQERERMSVVGSSIPRRAEVNRA